MPSPATITGYRVTAYDDDGAFVKIEVIVEADRRAMMLASLRTAIRWEREGYRVEHEPIIADASLQTGVQ